MSAPPARPSSLRRKFTQAVVLAALLPAICLGIADQVVGYRTQEQHLRDRAEVTALLSAAAVDEFLQTHLSGVTLLADLHSPGTGDWPRRLKELQERYPAFISALVTDAEGKVLAMVPEPPPDAPSLGVQDREYFLTPRTTGRPAISNTFVGRRLGSDSLVAASAPLMADGRFHGVVEGSIQVDAFTSLRASVIRDLGLEMLILDRGHRVVHASEGLPYRFLQQVDATAFSGEATSAQRATPAIHIKRAMSDGRNAWVSQARLQSGWILVIFAPDDDLWAAARQRALGTFSVVLLVVCGVWFAYAWQMRRFNGALQRLAEALNGLATHAQPDKPRIDALPEEFQPLGYALEDLSIKLADTSRDLERALEEQRSLSRSLQENLERREHEIEARTLELRKANAELDRLNRTDALTGCLNRRGLQHRLRTWGDANGRLREPMALIAIDVDWFKAYNDRYGHAAGDSTLRRVAETASALVGEEGALARMGGEEFLLVLPLRPEVDAAALAERIRRGVHALGIAHQDSPLGVVTVSIGLATGTPGMDYAEAFIEADDALYRAKHAGRNRVEL